MLHNDSVLNELRILERTIPNVFAPQYDDCVLHRGHFGIDIFTIYNAFGKIFIN